MEDVDLFNNSSLGWAQSPLSAVQSCSKHHIRINSCSPVFPASRPHTRTSSHNPVLSVGRHHAWTSSCSSFNPEETARLTNQEAAGTSQAVLWRVSLHGGRYHMWISAQLCEADQSTLVLSEERQGRAKHTQCSGLVPDCLWGHIYTPSPQVLSRVCHSRTSFPLCLLQENLLSDVCLAEHSPCVCFSERCFHLCLPQANTLSRVRSPKLSCDLTDFPNKLEVSTSGL